MATLEARGFVNKYERKTSGGGKEYAKFQLAVQQKRKEKGGVEVKETVYIQCVDFSGKELPGLHEGDRGLTAYVGVKGYLTVTGWCKDGKGGANMDLTVTEYEELEQKGSTGGGKPKAAGVEPPDPFALSQPSDTDGIPF